MRLYIAALCSECEFHEYFREATTSLFVKRTTNRERRLLRNADAQYIVAKITSGELQDVFTCSDSSDVLDAAFGLITLEHKPATSVDELAAADGELRYVYLMSPNDIIELAA